MEDRFSRPKREHPREALEFEFLALLNVFSGIANSISLQGHGGAVVLVEQKVQPPPELIKIKYRQKSDVLRDAFIKFMSARHSLADFVVKQENGTKAPDGKHAISEIQARDEFALLVEAIRFVSKLADCDGAIVLSTGLQLLGFGGEIRADLREGAKVFEVVDEMAGKHRKLDAEQFGQRHRSAIKLASQDAAFRVLVISQDGPISAIWPDDKRVFVKKGVNLVNINMPWA